MMITYGRKIGEKKIDENIQKKNGKFYYLIFFKFFVYKTIFWTCVYSKTWILTNIILPYYFSLTLNWFLPVFFILFRCSVAIQDEWISTLHQRPTTPRQAGENLILAGYGKITFFGYLLPLILLEIKLL